MDKHLEIENKYVIDVAQYDMIAAYMRTISHTKAIMADGIDYLFRAPNGAYLRYRRGEGHHELTVKRPVDGQTNQVRSERDLFISFAQPEDVAGFAFDLGCIAAYEIGKESMVWWLPNHTNVSIYHVNDKFGRRLGSFAEIEAEKGLPVDESKRLVEDTERLMARRFPEIFRPDLRLGYTMTDWLERIYAV